MSPSCLAENGSGELTARPADVGGQVAASNLGPIIWVVGASFDRRTDMLFENTPCDTLSMVMATVLDACKRDATEIKVRCWPTYKWRMDGEEQEGLAPVPPEAEGRRHIKSPSPGGR